MVYFELHYRYELHMVEVGLRPPARLGPIAQGQRLPGSV